MKNQPNCPECGKPLEMNVITESSHLWNKESGEYVEDDPYTHEQEYYCKACHAKVGYPEEVS